MSLTPSVFPTYINEQSTNSTIVKSLIINKQAKCSMYICFDINNYSTLQMDIKKIETKYILRKSINCCDGFMFKEYLRKINSINIYFPYYKIKLKTINIDKSIKIDKLNKIIFEVKKIKIKNIKKTFFFNDVKTVKLKLLIIKTQIANNKKLFDIASPFNVTDMYNYITKDSPYRLIIKFKRINKVIYPTTTIPYYGKITKRI